MKPLFANVVVDLFVGGGPIMWPILVCLVMALTVVLERVFWWWTLARRSRSETLNQTFEAVSDGRYEDALKLSDNDNDPFLATVHEGLVHAHGSMLGAMQLRATDEIEKAEKRLWILGTFITLAPLLGLLGTVMGIMRSFHFVGSDELSAAKVSGGISEALIATSCGLGIAIFCLLPFNYLNRRLARYRSRLERTINHVELLTESAKHHGHDVEEFAKQKALGKRSIINSQF